MRELIYLLMIAFGLTIGFAFQISTSLNEVAIPIYNYNNLHYTIQIKSDPPTAMRPSNFSRVIPDTGSSCFWLKLSETSNPSTLLSVSKKLDFAAVYGAGPVFGYHRKINLEIPAYLCYTHQKGQDTTTVKLKFYNITAASTVFLSKEIAAYPSDGILGLSPGSSFLGQVGTMFKRTIAFQLNTISYEEYKNYTMFSKNRIMRTRKGGMMVIGDFNDSNALYTPIGRLRSIDKWTVGLESLSVRGGLNQKSHSLDLRVLHNALVDSGTSLIIVPPIIADRINSAIGAKKLDQTVPRNQGLYAFDCEEYKKLKSKPSLLFHFSEGVTVEIKELSLPVWRDRSGIECLSIISTSPVDKDSTWVLGIGFMKEFTVLFDYGNLVIGLLPKDYYSSDCSAV